MRSRVSPSPGALRPGRLLASEDQDCVDTRGALRDLYRNLRDRLDANKEETPCLTVWREANDQRGERRQYDGQQCR